MSSNLLLTALMPHPPIIIPEIGGQETQLAQKTIDANKKLAEKIVSLAPDTIIIVTPHSIFDPYNISIYVDEELNCNFSQFRAPQVEFSFKNDTEFVKRLKTQNKTGYENIPKNTFLDHGSGVPLYFLNQAGYKGKIVVFNYCALDNKFHYMLGQNIINTIELSNEKFVFIASGDMSHRLKPNAPAGYEPNAHKFDEYIIDKIQTKNYQEIITINEQLRYIAGECAFNSLIVALGALDATPDKTEILSYEAPWGVGYLTAIL